MIMNSKEWSSMHYFPIVPCMLLDTQIVGNRKYDTNPFFTSKDTQAKKRS